MADYPLKGLKVGADTYTIDGGKPYVIKFASTEAIQKLGDTGNIAMTNAKIYRPDGTDITNQTYFDEIRANTPNIILEYEYSPTHYKYTLFPAIVPNYTSNSDYSLIFRYDVPQTDEYVLFAFYMPHVASSSSYIRKYRYSYDLKINTDLDTLLTNIDTAAPNTYTATITNAQQLYNIGSNNSNITDIGTDVSNIKNLWPSAYKLNILLDGTNKAKLEIVSRWYDGTNYRLICIAHNSNGQLYTIGGIMHKHANIVFDEILFYKVA